MRGRFVFLNHFLDTKLIFEEQAFRFARLLPYQYLKKLIALVPSYTFLKIGPIRTSIGKEAEGIGVACPLLPEHFVTLAHAKVLQRILQGIRIGERYGAKIVGLGGFTSVFGNEGEEVARGTELPVTSGNTFTALQTLRGVSRATSLMDRRLEDSTVAVLGATGDIGSICAIMLAKKAKTLILVARNNQRLIELQSRLNYRKGSSSIRICKSTVDATKESDIIVSVTSALTTLIEPELLRRGAIVCDVAYPANITREVIKHRKDVFVFEGGMSTLPGYETLPAEQRIRLEKYNPPGTIHGCLAETIILALEERYTNFSFGRGNISEAKLDEIGDMANRQGFDLPQFYCGAEFYNDASIEAIKKNAYLAKG